MKEFYLQSFIKIIAEQLRGIYLIDFMLVYIFAALIIIIPGRIKIKRNKGTAWSDVLAFYFWFAYVLVVIMITILRRGIGAKEFRIVTRFNFGGFHGGTHTLAQFFYCVLNVVLFIPYGIFSRFLRRNDSNVRGIIMTVLMSFIFTVFIETFQLATGSGYFEVTDIVTNLFGGIIGAIVGTLILAAIRGKKKNEQK